MPTVRVTAIEGHSPEKIREFMERVTDACEGVLGASREGVVVHFEMLPPEQYMRGGLTIAERRAAATTRK